MDNNYILYSFSNFYLSSLQQGLQTAHLVAELFAKYRYDSSEYKILEEWAAEDKTIVILNGGDSNKILHTYALFEDGENYGFKFPYAKFRESSLSNTVTVSGIILPQYRSMVYFDWINDYKLAG